MEPILAAYVGPAMPYTMGIDNILSLAGPLLMKAQNMWQTQQLWLQKACLGIASAQKLNFSALPICFCSVGYLHE